MNQYQSPTIEIQEVLVEKGFAGSVATALEEAHQAAVSKVAWVALKEWAVGAI